MESLKIPTTQGEHDVAVHYEDNCNNLCVTMTHFGVFEITHKHSGRKLYGGFERASSATSEMLKLELCLTECGIDQPLSMQMIQDSINSNRTKFSRLGDMTIIEYIRLCTNLGKIANEFPWETYEESPFGSIDKFREELKGLTQ